jgi:hypothetical protein
LIRIGSGCGSAANKYTPLAAIVKGTILQPLKKAAAAGLIFRQMEWKIFFADFYDGTNIAIVGAVDQLSCPP